MRIRRCQSGTLKRDDYRYSGGNKMFTLRYEIRQCTRRSIAQSEYCTQHNNGYRYVLRHTSPFLKEVTF